MNGQRCTLRRGVALTACFDGVSVRIARLCIADAQRAGVHAIRDGDASTKIAVVQNSRALLPDESDGAWTAGRGGEGCRLTFANRLVSRIGSLIRINADISRNSLVIACDVDGTAARCRAARERGRCRML